MAPPLIRDYLPVADTSSYSSSVRRLTKAQAQAEAQASVTIDVLRSEGCSFHQFLSRRTTLPGYNSKPLSSVLMDELSRLKSKNMYIVKIINGRGTLLRIQKPTDVTKNILTDFCSNHLRYKSSSLKNCLRKDLIVLERFFVFVLFFLYIHLKILQYMLLPTIPSNYYTTIQHYRDDTRESKRL